MPAKKKKGLRLTTKRSVTLYAWFNGSLTKSAHIWFEDWLNELARYDDARASNYVTTKELETELQHMDAVQFKDAYAALRELLGRARKAKAFDIYISFKEA